MVKKSALNRPSLPSLPPYPMQAIPGPFNSIGRALQPGGAGDALSQQLAGVLGAFKPIGFNVNLARITQDAKAALLL